MEILNNVVWEKCIKEERCVKIGWPVNDKFCLSISACLRIVEKKGNLSLEVDAFSRTWSFPLTSACHTFYEMGYARFKICISPNGKDSVKIVLEGCLGIDVDSIDLEECWTLLAVYPRWLAAKNLTGEELLSLGVETSTIHQYNTLSQQKNDVTTFVSCERDMTPDDIIDTLAQPKS